MGFDVEGVVDGGMGGQETLRRARRFEPLHLASDAIHLAAPADGLLLVSRALDEDLEGRAILSLRTRFHAERVELVVRT